MSRESAFLVLYPVVMAVADKGRELERLLEEATSREEEPDSGWIPVLRDAAVALEAASSRCCSPHPRVVLPPTIRGSTRIVEESFSSDATLLFEALGRLQEGLNSLQEYLEQLAANAFGQFGGHFFWWCSNSLPSDYFSRDSYEPLGPEDFDSLFDGCPDDDQIYPKRPVWDRENKKLYWGLTTIRRFRNIKRAKNVVRVLDEFQELGWPRRIDDPLPSPSPDPERLRDTVKRLNERLEIIQFRADGSGQGIEWRIREYPEVPADSDEDSVR